MGGRPQQRRTGSQDIALKSGTLPGSPWIFKKRIARPASPPPPGAYVGLRSPSGKLLARGFYNKRSEIAFRVLGGPDAPPDLRGLLAMRLADALKLRIDVLGLDRFTNAWRLLNAEGDGLSGLVVDRYANTCVASLYSQGWVKAAELVEESLKRLEGIEQVLFRADARTQKLEGFRLPDVPPGRHVTVQESRLKYRVDLSTGHKTGLFLDQRDNRTRVAGLAKGRRMLDLCTNAGGFAIAARGPGKAKHVTAVDLDEKAIEHAVANARLNDLRISFRHADLFPYLRERKVAGDLWDLIVLDPPKLGAGRNEVPKPPKVAKGPSCRKS